MICPYCHSANSKCTNSRPTPSGRRRRHYTCKDCKRTFVSVECYASDFPGGHPPRQGALGQNQQETPKQEAG